MSKDKKTTATGNDEIFVTVEDSDILPKASDSIPPPPAEIMALSDTPTTTAEATVESDPFAVEPIKKATAGDMVDFAEISYGISGEDDKKAAEALPLFDPSLIAAPEPVADTQPMEAVSDPRPEPKDEGQAEPKMGQDDPPPPPQRKPVINKGMAKWIVGVIVGICAVIAVAAAYRGCTEQNSGYTPPPIPAPPTTVSATHAPTPAPTTIRVQGVKRFDATKCRDDQITLLPDGSYLFSDCVTTR